MAAHPDISRYRLLVIVPAFNEGARINSALNDLSQNAPWADVLVVDDGSADDTAAQAEAALSQRPARRGLVVRLPFNLGVGGAMQTGYLYAARSGYDVAIQFDGDGQHCADQIAELVEPILTGRCDLVVGSRLMGGSSYRFSALRWMGSRLLAGMVRLLTGLRISDPTSGFRAASPRMIDFFSRYYPQAYLGDTVEALAWAAWQGMRIAEVPAAMRMVRTSSISNFLGLIHMMRICVALLIDRIEGKLPPE